MDVTITGVLAAMWPCGIITLLCELLQYHMQRMPAQLEATPKLHPIPAKAPWYHMGIDSCYSESFK